VSYTSDHFPKIIELARQLIQSGNGYMDKTEQEQMRQERMDGIDSVYRNTSIETNLDLFNKMLKNDPQAQGFCLRGKIDMQAKNKTLRDPVFFRANAIPHHRTGTKYCAYPTYDFACPIVDSTEGVTHALRTTEYNDRDAQYQWVLQTLGLGHVRIHAFARMNFVHSVLSKRKLQWFVDQGHVEGWNDPRFPTIQGVLRRGVQVGALREFILSQGASRRITDMEWDKFWTLNKRIIDPVAPRYFALNASDAIPLTLTNTSFPSNKVIGWPVVRHPKNPQLGEKIMRLSSNLLVEYDDVVLMNENQQVTLMRYGNVIIRKILKDENGKITSVQAQDYPQGDFKTTKLKITWLAHVNDLVAVELIEFDHLITKPKLEENDKLIDFLTPITRAKVGFLVVFLS
jgi:glutamyl-tRNA synthetase